VPLYQGGGEHARLRRAKELREARARALDEALRVAEADARAAHHDRRTAAARIRSLQAQADAAAFALDGVRQEAVAGARTVLDVLDAEEELYRAEAALLRARREQAVASYRLRAAAGRLTAEALALPVQAYDPGTHYRDVRNRWFGLGGVGSRR
jgi:outer membrane protein